VLGKSFDSLPFRVKASNGSQKQTPNLFVAPSSLPSNNNDHIPLLSRSNSSSSIGSSSQHAASYQSPPASPLSSSPKTLRSNTDSPKSDKRRSRTLSPIQRSTSSPLAIRTRKDSLKGRLLDESVIFPMNGQQPQQQKQLQQTGKSVPYLYIKGLSDSSTRIDI
jgi:hypothetical protein